MAKQRTKLPKLHQVVETTVKERKESYNKVLELIQKMKTLKLNPDEVFLGKNVS